MNLVLPAALAVLVLGMVAVIIGVIAPVFFYPGIYLIALGMIGTAAAGILRLRPA